MFLIHGILLDLIAHIILDTVAPKYETSCLLT